MHSKRGTLRVLSLGVAVALVTAVGCSSSDDTADRDAPTTTTTTNTSATTLAPTTSSVAAPSTAEPTTTGSPTGGPLTAESLTAVFNTVEKHLTRGFATVEPADVLRLNRLSQRAVQQISVAPDGSIQVLLDTDDECLWFRYADEGRFLIGSSALPCAPDGDEPVLSFDGGGAPSAALQLRALDRLARQIADRLYADLLGIVNGKSRTVEEIAEYYPLFYFVETSRGPGELSLTVDGPSVRLAIQSQSGTCYLIAAEITSNTKVRRGTTTEGPCSASEADANALTHDWP